MPQSYVSSSPKYLDYIASSMTREEILADDRLCKLLNDPYIKDNMETALAFAEAEAGGYNEKVQFVKQFMCNGPELDTDTIIHYRNIILSDDEYSTIAADYFNDITSIDDFRVNEFDKDTAETSDGNCFLNPCNYLNNLSLNLGAMAEAANFRTVKNIFSLIVKQKKDEKDEEEAKKEEKKKNDEDESLVSEEARNYNPKQVPSLEEFTKMRQAGKVWTDDGWKDESSSKDGEKENPSEPKRSDVDTSAVNGSIRYPILLRLPPGIRKGYGSLMSNIASAYEDFATVLAASNIPLDLMQVGDYNAIRNAESVSMMIRANIFSKMGDCARVWRDLRNLNYYKPEQNTVQPAPESAAVANKTVTGTPKKKPVNKTDNRALAKNVKVETKTDEVSRNYTQLPSGALTGLSNNAGLGNMNYVESSGVSWDISDTVARMSFETRSPSQILTGAPGSPKNDIIIQTQKYTSNPNDRTKMNPN